MVNGPVAMKLARHLAGYLPANLASAIASFGGVYVYTRLLGADEYGRYALMFSVLALIHTITLAPGEAAAVTAEAHLALHSSVALSVDDAQQRE